MKHYSMPKKIIFIFLISFFALQVHAQSIFRVERSIIPETDSIYYLGTTTPSTRAWLGVITDTITLTNTNLSGSTRCLQITSAGVVQTASSACGSGGGGGTDGNWTYSTNYADLSAGLIYVSTSTNQVVIGNTSTSSRASLEVRQIFSGGGSLLVNSSTTLQNFTFVLATGSSATTTNFFATTASSTNLFATNATSSILSITGTASTSQLFVSSAGGGVAGCATFSALGLISNTGVACGTGGGGGNSKWATSTDNVAWIHTGTSGLASNIGIGTTTPRFLSQLATSTAPQIAFSSGILGNNHFIFRNAGGLFYLATASPSTFATSTNSIFEVGLNGTTTFGVNGLNLSNGCYAIAGVCIGGSGSANATLTTSEDLDISLCAPEATSTRFFIGGAWYGPMTVASTTNGLLSINSLNFGAATTSSVTCPWHVPNSIANTPALFIAPVYVATTTGTSGYIDIEADTVTTNAGNYDPTPVQFVNIIAGSTTASQRVTTNSTTRTSTSSTYSMSAITPVAGDVVYIRITRWGASDTINGDLAIPRIKMIYDIKVN